MPRFISASPRETSEQLSAPLSLTLAMLTLFLVLL